MPVTADHDGGVNSDALFLTSLAEPGTRKRLEGARGYLRPGAHGHRHAVLHEPRDMPGEAVQPQDGHVELRVSVFLASRV